MSSDPLIARSPQITLLGAGTVVDPHRRVELAVSPAAWAILAATADLPVPAATLWPGGVTGDAAGHLLELAEHGLVHVRFRPGTLPRLAVRAIATGSDAQLRMYSALSCRRVAVTGRSWFTTYLRTIAVVIRAFAAVVLCGGAALALLTWVAAGSVALAAWAGSTPLVVMATLGAHEAAHLVALRHLTGDLTSGALLIGPTRLSIIRPHLAGRELRMVAAAGPLAGTACGLAAALLVDVVPLIGIAGMVAVALHLANLVPLAPDGRDLWAGAVAREPDEADARGYR